MRYRLFLVLFLLSISASIFCQPAELKSVLNFPYKTSEDLIIKRLKENKTTFLPEDWETVCYAVKNHNNRLETQIRKLDISIDEIYQQLKQLYALNNLDHIREYLEELETVKSSIAEVAEKQLQQIGFRGVYLVILENYSIFDDDSLHLERVRNAILPEAIATLNGAFIHSATTIQDNQVLYDALKESVSGNMILHLEEFSDRSFSSKYFVQIWQVEVFPLQDKPTNGEAMRTMMEENKVKIVDLSNRGEAKDELSDIKDPILKVKLDKFLATKLADIQEDVKSYNELSAKSEGLLLQNVKDRFAAEDQKILFWKSEIERNMQYAKQLAQNIGASYDSTDIDATLFSITEKLTEKLTELNLEKTRIKSEELFTTQIDVSAQGGSPATILVKEALSKTNTIQQVYATIKGFWREISLSNGEVTDFSIITKNDVFRTLDKFWLYPIPNGNIFKLGIVSKFKVKSLGELERESVTLNQPINSGYADSLSGTMIPIKKGSFSMGCNGNRKEEQPIHGVAMHDFLIGKYEITHRQYCQFLNNNVDKISVHDSVVFCNGRPILRLRYTSADKRLIERIQFIDGRFVVMKGCEDLPIVMVSWVGAVEYCKWLSEKTQKLYRLPTEAEWEYAAKGGSTSTAFTYAGSNAINEVAWYANDRLLSETESLHKVGTKKPNSLGIFDMSGNAYEWCWDLYHENYLNAPTDGSPWLEDGSPNERIIRGGGVFSAADDCTVCYRERINENMQSMSIGFRVVCEK